MRYFIVTVALSVHLLFINWFFPFTEALNNAPILNYDYPFHQERSIDRMRYIADGNTIWGYNPRLMAGYIDGIVVLNDGITHWLNYVTKGIGGQYIVYKVWIMLLLILPVIVVPFAACLFGFRSIWPLSLVFTVILLHSHMEIRNYYLYGMPPFVFANFISLLSVAAFWAYNQKRTPGNFLLVLFLLPLSFLVHPLSLFLEIICFGVIFFGTCWSYRAREWMQILLLVSVTFLINWHWIKVFIDFQSFALPELGESFLRAYPRKFIDDYLVEIQNLPAIWITILGLFGLWIMHHQSRNRLLYRTFFLGVFSFWLLAYWGGRLGLSWIQPYRFNISIPIFLLLPATYAVVVAFQWLQMYLPPSPLKVILPLLMICPIVGFHITNNYAGSIINHKTDQFPRLTTVMADELEWMISWLKHNTENNARIAIQEVGKIPPIGRSHFMPWVAVRTGRELIGNYHYKAHTVYGVVAVDEKFIGIPFEQLTSEKLKELCEQYNIQTVILHVASAKSTMKKFFPIAQPVAQYDQLEVFRINITPSFFLSGTGELSADLNSIKVKKATSPMTIIKYHYFALLKTKPALPIERYPVPNDPIGFIKVINENVSEFEIYTDYDSSRQSLVP